jgi:polysaccharide export outer membrane protein
MILRRWISVLVLAALASSWTGCQTDSPKEQFVCVDDEIRIGDTLKISLLDILTPEPEKDYVVRNDGTVNLSLLGPMKAAGKKFGDFEREVQSEYIKRQIYKHCTVVVKPDVRFYTVAGEVRQPNRMPYFGQTTVLRAIAACGDFTEFANRKKVEITRANGKRELVDTRKAQRDARFDVQICPGDYILVPRTVL